MVEFSHRPHSLCKLSMVQIPVQDVPCHLDNQIFKEIPLSQWCMPYRRSWRWKRSPLFYFLSQVAPRHNNNRLQQAKMCSMQTWMHKQLAYLRHYLPHWLKSVDWESKALKTWAQLAYRLRNRHHRIRIRISKVQTDRARPACSKQWNFSHIPQTLKLFLKSLSSRLRELLQWTRPPATIGRLTSTTALHKYHSKCSLQNQVAVHCSNTHQIL